MFGLEAMSAIQADRIGARRGRLESTLGEKLGCFHGGWVLIIGTISSRFQNGSEWL